MQRSVGQGQFAYANPPDSSASTFRPLTGRSGTTRGAITSDSASYDPTSNQRSAFEEYRYDALGRRVLMRARQEYGCAQNCQNVVRRTIWDGDQVLAEIQAPGATNTPAFQMESEVMMGQVNTGSLTLPAHLMDEAEVAPSDTLPQAQTYGGFHYGRVLYTHGPGIDAPLSLVRMAYSDSLWTPQLVVLHNDWRGQYDIGSYAGGSLNKPCRRVVRSSNFQTYGSDGQVSEYPKFSGPLNANWFHCIEVEWPAPHVWVTRETRNRSLTGPIGWMGTLIDGMRDLSGQMYMRNRYYDPRGGRFTQEDPIGLAGGLNVYGFANGDPVSYGDPYGLCIWFWLPRCRNASSRVTFGDVAHTGTRLWNIAMIMDMLFVREQAQQMIAARQGGWGRGSLAASRANAFRHIFGACYLTLTRGQRQARGILRAHERTLRHGDAAQAEDSRRDTYNNEVGILEAEHSGPRPASTASAYADASTCEQIADRHVATGQYSGEGGSDDTGSGAPAPPLDGIP